MTIIKLLLSRKSMLSLLSRALFGLQLLIGLRKTLGWNVWNYSVQWNEDPLRIENTRIPWESLWSNYLSNNQPNQPAIFTPNYIGDPKPPRPRRGHSLHIIKTDSRSDEYKGHTYIIMFGGRDNDQNALHIPKTYNVQTVGACRLSAMVL